MAEINGATWTTNIKGQNVLSFDGTDDYVSITASNIDGYFNQKSFSVCVWVKFDNSSSNGHELIFSVSKAANTNQLFHISWESDEKLRLDFMVMI